MSTNLQSHDKVESQCKKTACYTRNLSLWWHTLKFTKIDKDNQIIKNNVFKKKYNTETHNDKIW